MTPRRLVASMAVLSAASTASKPELQKITLPRLDFEKRQRPKVSRLSSRARRAFNACGWTSPMACSSFSICFCPARTTRGFAWPAAATPKAAVRSRYLRPSASQTCAPRARSQTMGHEPSGSENVTLRDSKSRSWSMTCRVLFMGKASNSPFLRRPDDLVQLRLKTDGQGIGDDPFGQLAAGYRRLSRRNFFQGLVLLLRGERMHPGKKQRTDGIELVRGDLLFRPVIILTGGE